MAMTQSFSSSFSRRPPPSSSTFSSPGTRAPPPLTPSWAPPRHRARRRALTAASSIHLGPEEIAELARNKVLIAATLASAIGQLSKPFTSVKNGGGVDIRAAVRSGGMPSTHSSVVVAVTTSLGLERGFADSIFGMSVVFAAIVMYDAQGVRREVGNHARLLNKLWTIREKTAQNSEYDGFGNSASELHSAKHERAADLVSVPEKTTSSYRSNVSPSSRHNSSGTKLSRLNALRSSDPELTELTELKQAYAEECNRLSESVGHTELQVVVGALLGFVVSLAVYATL